jgi:TolA-binding protein
VRTLPDGRELTVYALTPDRVAFIEAADRVTSHTFEPSADPELPDYQQAVDERRAAIQYVVAQMLFYHNRFDEARPRFEALIAAHPRAIESNYAAGLLVDSYLAEGDLAQVRAYTKRFTLNPPGPPQEVDADRFKGTLEGSTFKLALDQAEAPGTDPLTAAAAFLAFRSEFPSSEFSADALYNAAYYTQQAGKVEQANALYEQFVAENPKDDRSKGLYFRIAANYEAAFELADAVAYYDKVLTHPAATPAEKADAQYNRSFLLIGLGRHREAAQGFETYEAKYPEQEDREQILWLAGEEWEQVSRAEAIEFYNRYKRKYPDANPDHFLEAESRILELMREQGASAASLRRQSDAISAAFDRFTRASKPIGPNGHRAAASAAFPALQAQFDAYADDKLTGNEDRDTTLLNETKPKELRDLEANIKDYVSKYQSFEHSSAALLLQAKAALYLADLGLSIRCPAGLSDDDCFLYEDILEEQVFPAYYEIEEVGLRRLQELVQAAKDKKRHSPSIDEAMQELNRRRPTDFPAVKPELEGGTDSSIPVDLAPKRITPVPAPAPVPAPVPEQP